MTNREKIIQGLACYLDSTRACTCEKCPHWESGVDCATGLIYDALRVIKEQEQTINNLQDVIAILEGR